MEKNIKLGKRIAWLRKIKKMEQKHAAAAIGINYGTYQRYEYGYPPSRKNMQLILQYYKCNEAWLLTGEGEPFPGISMSPPKTEEGYINITQQSAPGSDNPFAQYDQAKDDLREIFNSGDPVLIPAIVSNLTAFKRALLRERQIAQVLEENRDLKERLSNLEKRCEDFSKKIIELSKTINQLQEENSKLNRENKIQNALDESNENPAEGDGRSTIASKAG